MSLVRRLRQAVCSRHGHLPAVAFRQAAHVDRVRVLRQLGTVAERYSAKGRHTGVAVKECGNCDNVLPDNADDLCSRCQQFVHFEAVRGLATIDHLLGLEAEFVQWCADHGQPNPHD